MGNYFYLTNPAYDRVQDEIDDWSGTTNTPNHIGRVLELLSDEMIRYAWYIPMYRDSSADFRKAKFAKSQRDLEEDTCDMKVAVMNCLEGTDHGVTFVLETALPGFSREKKSCFINCPFNFISHLINFFVLLGVGTPNSFK